jgi:von Willebrand factor type A domain
MGTQATVPPPPSGSVSNDQYALEAAPISASTPPAPPDAGPATNGTTQPATAEPTQVPAAPVAPKTPEELKAEKALARKRRQRQAEIRVGAPAWLVSLVVHVGLLALLAVTTLHADTAKKIIANINSALVANRGGEPEMTPIYADPGAQRSQEAVGNEHAETAGGSAGGFGGIGTGPPSATPAIGKVGRVGGGGGSGTGIGGFKFNGNLSPLANLTTGAPGMDLGGGGLVAGDVTYEASDVGQSLDQIAREILRHLTQHKLTVIWLFDESESMKDDQKAIREKFDRVASELKVNVDNSKKAAGALTHAIVGFGADIHYELEKPTLDIDVIGRAIDRLRVDDSGTENTLHAINEVINHYGGLIKKDRKLLIVLVTDESGDDGAYIEEAHQAAVSKGVPLYIIGRQSLFGYEHAHLRYIDPVTKDVYWPAIRRGPETADVELMQWDGLHDRWDEQPSGFAPYELARMAKDTGGIYFLLPSEENMRGSRREKAYRIADLKEYVPDYANRAAYMAVRQKSELRRTLYDIIQTTRWQPGANEPYYYRRHFPIDPGQLVPACAEAATQATVRLNVLLKIQQRMEELQKLRDREPEKRWQAHYDLMLAQIVAYQIKSYEYRATVEEMARKPPKPNKMPTADLVVEWVIDHSHDRKAPKENTEKKYVEATKLLKEVIARHPKTPWADLAQDELDRGLGTQRNEWHHNPKYGEREKLVPKY